jgi:hypothetical protein
MGLLSAARVVGACFLPIALLEVGTQRLGEVGPLGPMGSAALSETVGLQYPSRCHRNHLGALYADRAEAAATLCSDAWGTIEPTSLRALDAGADRDAYILACGGSTTEMFAVEAEERWVARLARALDVRAVNAGASSKAMAKCAQTLDHLLRRIPADRPPLILIATNVNTLGTFIAARFHGWSGGAPPEQRYAPPPLHPEVRAWIPGLYHLAALTISALDLPPEPSYADQLAQGCCHIPGDANRRPGHRFDWRAEDNRALYDRFVAASLDAIDDVLDRHKIARDRVLFMMEPNSYGHASMPHLARDVRQPLYGLDGERLSFATAAALIQDYDEIYARRVGERYTVIRADRFDLPADGFYDAVHMTAAGAEALAERLAPILQTRLPMP